MAAKKKVTKKAAAKKKPTGRARPNTPPQSPKKTAEKFKPGRWHVNQTDAADFCQVSIQVFQRRGIEPAGRSGRNTYYDLRRLKAWEKDRERKLAFEEGQRSRPASIENMLEETGLAELEWTRERAEGQRLKNAAMRRELAPVDMVTWAIGSIAGQVSAILGTLPTKIKRSMPKLGADEIRIIKSEIVKAQNACAKEVQLRWDEFSPESD